MASALLQQALEPGPAVAILNHYTLDLTRAQTKLLQQLLTTSKHTIARALKAPTVGILKTKNRMTEAIIHNKIEASILERRKGGPVPLSFYLKPITLIQHSIVLLFLILTAVILYVHFVYFLLLTALQALLMLQWI